MSLFDLEDLVQQAREVVPLEVKLNGNTIPTLDSSESSWFSLDTTRPLGRFVLNQILENGQLADRGGFCFQVWWPFPSSLFVPSSPERYDPHTSSVRKELFERGRALPLTL